jgi:hypothetical protein
LGVLKDGQCARLGDVLRHETRHGLVGVEVQVRPPYEGEAPCQRHHDDECQAENEVRLHARDIFVSSVANDAGGTADDVPSAPAVRTGDGAADPAV